MHQRDETQENENRKLDLTQHAIHTLIIEIGTVYNAQRNDNEEAAHSLVVVVLAWIIYFVFGGCLPFRCHRALI